MTSADQERELKRFQMEQKAEKIAACLKLGRSCGTCPDEHAGCDDHPRHQAALKEEPIWE